MTQKARIRKLEDVGQSKYTVVMPVFEDSAGEEISSPSLPETVAVARIQIDGFSIAREAEERPEDFQRRVMSIARERYKPCVVLNHGSAYA